MTQYPKAWTVLFCPNVDILSEDKTNNLYLCMEIWVIVHNCCHSSSNENPNPRITKTTWLPSYHYHGNLYLWRNMWGSKKPRVQLQTSSSNLYALLGSKQFLSIIIHLIKSAIDLCRFELATQFISFCPGNPSGGHVAKLLNPSTY